MAENNSVSLSNESEAGNPKTNKSNRKITHGMTSHPVYQIWEGMKCRCHTKTSGGYRKYGGKGIEVIEPWRSSFQAFFEDMGPTWMPGLSIERNDSKGHYCKDNCRWATLVEQNNNRSCNAMITMGGQTHTIAQWARIIGINHKALRGRLDNGWSTEDALTIPIGSRSRNKIK